MTKPLEDGTNPIPPSMTERTQFHPRRRNEPNSALDDGTNPIPTHPAGVPGLSLALEDGTNPIPAPRVASVDALRGLTILLMVFVNDLGPSAPKWMHHIEPSNADGMTLADLVFPWFLFIVGVSIPLAFERARSLGTPAWKQVGHVLIRTLGLLFMGVVVMNHEDDKSPRALLWGTLAYGCLILAWCGLPREPGKSRNIWIGLKAAGAVGLVALLAIFRTPTAPAELPFWGKVENWAWLRIGWWGILGLIGWAYLTVALLTLGLGRRREWLMGALGLLMALHLAINHGGLFTRVDKKPWLGAARPAVEMVRRGVEGVERFVSLGESTGSLAAIAMAGCLLGSILRRDSDVLSHRARLTWAACFALGLVIAGLMTDTFEGINKNAATPAWCFFSAAMACLVWMILYSLMDVARVGGWSILIRPAGANPLVAYFLHPITVGAVTLLGFGGTVLAYQDSPDWRVAVGGSLAMAGFVCGTTGLLGRLGLRVRL
jgi:heparan-alpha-glucosaminide N-acetyltransferase